ncbi:VWA domain-containing protein [Puia sp.]|jgi:Ca-activated chloride channel family protein|uniref:VWA domain-containing protein n=1 Tax=Puia sp. TaxID=2045100 RepID=UPI002F3F37D5
MFRLEHSDYLIGLGALPLLGAAFYFLISWKKKTAAGMGDPALVQQLIGNFSPWRFGIKVTVAFLAFLIIVLAATNPQRPGAMENVQRKGVDVMLVLDVSKSMLARDIKPSRLEKAKQLLLLLTDKLDNDRIGLILFAGRSYLQMPLTTDHGAARMYIQQASPDAVPTQGTVIGEALQMANTAFNSKERKYKSIVLISDGEDHDPEAMKVAQGLAKNGVMINAVGIGSPDGSPIVDPATNELKKDEQGNTVISKLNETELQQLANTTNGEYIRLDNIDDALITMTQRIDSAEKKSMSDAEFIDYKSYFQWLAGAALLLLVIEFFLSERRRKKKDARPGLSARVPAGAAVRTTLLVLGILIAALPAAAQAGNAQLRSGNRFYKKKQIDQSLRQYQSAVQQAPDNPTANYNLGNAQFRKNNYDEATHSYDATVKNSANDKAMQERGYYNKGVAMIKQKKLQESIDAWKQALKLDATDADARENLERALIQQKQQQKQQQKNQQDQKKDQKDKKDDKKDQDQQQQQQPKPQPSRLNKQQVEQLLKALEQKENDLQNKMKQNKVKAPNQPEKDW